MKITPLKREKPAIALPFNLGQTDRLDLEHVPPLIGMQPYGPGAGTTTTSLKGTMTSQRYPSSRRDDPLRVLHSWNPIYASLWKGPSGKDFWRSPGISMNPT